MSEDNWLHSLVLYPEDGEVPHRIPPRAVQKIGCLCDEDSPGTEDLAAYRFDDGTWLDVGWHPRNREHGGAYIVRVVRQFDDWHTDDSIKLMTNDVREVARFITDFDVAREYAPCRAAGES